MKSLYKYAMKVFVLTNIIAPYRIAFYNALSKIIDVDLLVCYVAEQEHNRSWISYKEEMHYRFNILPGFHLPCGHNRTVHVNYGLSYNLNKFQPDVIVTGTDIISTPASWSALIWARRRKVPIIRYEGQHILNSSRYIRNLLYTIYYRFCDSFFVYSFKSVIYLQNFGISPSKVVNGYNVGDTARVCKISAQLRSQSCIEIERDSYPPIIFLFAGQLITRKGIDLLLSAWDKAAIHDAGLVLVGDGPLRNIVLEYSKNPKESRIYSLGFLQRDQALRLFAMANIFVLPTRGDPASIALGEALHSGLFCIASIYDGSTSNFIINGLNGLSIDPLVPDSLRNALVIAADWVRQSGADSRSTVQKTMDNFTVEHYASRLANLARSLLRT